MKPFIETDLSFIDSVALDTGFLNDNEETKLNDQDKGFALLNLAIDLYRKQLEGVVLSSRHELLKEVQELTGVQAVILLYALKYGVVNAHMNFYDLKDDPTKN